jgi:hypothetical protein
MATYIKAGLYRPPFVKDDEDLEVPDVYIDAEVVQVLNDDDEMVVQFTYEELRGIMAIMAAEQEKNHIHIKAKAAKN